jgi:hypothetical protein
MLGIMAGIFILCMVCTGIVIHGDYVYSDQINMINVLAFSIAAFAVMVGVWISDNK